ncbi:DMT family transporter [Ahrensia sp. R2A130]|uniref:DMT family transporter n=1 Tax=Ahrensia sp. R2A130 TaxID=744979 RepID=UPI0001E08C65|nr:DMT family transporter [Ahrensia sp. R2A130]EFL88527.1 putative membrane protein [Ahrensia sp. R2A130]
MTADSVTPVADPRLVDANPSDRRLTAVDYVLYVVLVASWSGSWYALALQVGEVAVQTSLFWRFVIAASVMWVWTLGTKQRVAFPMRAHLAFCGMGFFIFCFNFMLFYYGSAYLFSGLLSVVFSLASVFNLLLIFALSGKAPRARVVAGALLGFAGIALMFAPQMEGQDWTGGTMFGLGLCVAGTLSFCVGSQISAALQRAKVPIIPTSAWGMSYGALFALLMTLALGNSITIIWTPVYIGSLVFLALVSSVLAFWSYLTLIGRIGAGRASYATVLFPVFALLISAVFEGYGFPLLAIAGLTCVLAGNILVLGSSKK